MPQRWITVICSGGSPSAEKSGCWTRRPFLKPPINFYISDHLPLGIQNQTKQKSRVQFGASVSLSPEHSACASISSRRPEPPASDWTSQKKTYLYWLLCCSEQTERKVLDGPFFTQQRLIFFHPLLGLKHSCPACRHFKHDQICASLQITTGRQ